MNKYTTMPWQLKRGIVNFSENITRRLCRPAAKFFAQMLFGMLASGSIMLTQIGRELNEKISLKKTEERLSRNLNNYERFMPCIQSQYLEEAREFIDSDTIFCLDPGDICKKCKGKQEGQQLIPDGSDKHKAAPGWPLIAVTALSHKTKYPIPVYARLYESGGSEYGGQTGEVLAAIKDKVGNFGAGGILTMDRGMDANDIYRLLLESGQQFVVRNKVNRMLLTEAWGKTSTLAISVNYLGKIKMTFEDKKGKKHKLGISSSRVKLPEFPDNDLSLVIVHGFRADEGLPPMLLLTNMPAKTKDEILRVVKAYMCRWRIEEFYRFAKEKMDLENVRVMSLKSLRAMVSLVAMLAGYIAIFAHRDSTLSHECIFAAKRIKKNGGFILYSLAEGIRRILATQQNGIRSFFTRPAETPLSHQLSFFKPDRFNYSAVCTT